MNINIQPDLCRKFDFHSLTDVVIVDAHIIINCINVNRSVRIFVSCVVSGRLCIQIYDIKLYELLIILIFKSSQLVKTSL